MNQTEREGLLQALAAGLARTGGPLPATIGPGTGFPDSAENWAAEDAASLLVAIEAAVSAGRAAWPGVSLGDAEFALHLGHVLAAGAKTGSKTGADIAASMSGLHIEDLFLAAACARGDLQALAELERHYLAPLPAVVRGAGVSAQ